MQNTITLPEAPSDPDHDSNCNPLDAEKGDVVLIWQDGCLDKWELVENVEYLDKATYGYRIDSQKIYHQGDKDVETLQANEIHKQSGQDQDDPKLIDPLKIAGIK